VESSQRNNKQTTLIDDAEQNIAWYNMTAVIVIVA